MGDEQTPDNSQVEPGQTPPDGSPEGGQAAGQGDSWSPEVQAKVTRMRQEDKAELADTTRELRAEFSERLAELRREAVPRAPEGLPEGITPDTVRIANEVFQQTPAFKQLTAENQRLRAQASEESIAAGLDALREEPFFDELHGDVEAELRRIAASENAPPLNRGTARYVWMDKAYPRIVEALKGAKGDAETARKEKADALSAATGPGSVSGASGGEPQVKLSDEEMETALEDMTPEQFRQAFSGKG